MKTFFIYATMVLVFVGCGSQKETIVHKTPKALIQQGTFAQDWRNFPDWEKIVGFTYASLAPRAQLNGGPVGGGPAAENLIAQGVKVLFLIFPCYYEYLGEPLPRGDWNREMEELANQYNANLLNADGSRAQTSDECFMVDFSNGTFVKELVKLAVNHLSIGNGIHQHVACTNVSYDPALSQITTEKWDAWSLGYQSYFSQLRKARPDWEIIGVCDRWGYWTDDMYDGIYFEHIGSSLNPVGSKTFTELAKGERDVVALFETDTFVQRRRGAAAMALLRDGLFQFGREATVTKNPEHFDIYYGTFSDSAKEISTGVWERIGSHGLVVLNISGSTYNYVDPIQGNTYPLIDGDALCAQFKDKTTGADLSTWVTNL